MTSLIELERLYWQRPSLGAPDAVVAAWYEAKATVHEQLAAESRDAQGRSRELHFADKARARATALRATTPGADKLAA